MAQVQITDVVVPAEFTAYQVENSMVSTALFQSGVVLPNGEMQAQLNAAAQSFTVPFWSDIPDVEADITNDNPAILSSSQKFTAASQVVRQFGSLCERESRTQGPRTILFADRDQRVRKC